VIEDSPTKSLDWMMRYTFKMEIMHNRASALPPGFIDEPESAREP
jgi:hypothetical protein